MPVRVDVQEESEQRAGPRWLAVLMWLLLALTLGFAFWLLLNACGLRVLRGAPILYFCPAPAARPAPDPTLGAEIARQRALESEIERLELALLQAPACAPGPTEAETEVVPEPEPIPEDAWREQDIGFLEGCWILETDYTVRNVETNVLRRAEDWEVCFDAAGEGRQTLTFDDGTRCTGPMLGEFGEQDRLLLKDTGNLQCADGFEIYERHMTCERVDAVHAQCDTFQPESGGRSDVTLRHEDREGD